MYCVLENVVSIFIDVNLSFWTIQLFLEISCDYWVSALQGEAMFCKGMSAVKMWCFPGYNMGLALLCIRLNLVSATILSPSLLGQEIIRVANRIQVWKCFSSVAAVLSQVCCDSKGQWWQKLCSDLWPSVLFRYWLFLLLCHNSLNKVIDCQRKTTFFSFLNG